MGASEMREIKNDKQKSIKHSTVNKDGKKSQSLYKEVKQEKNQLSEIVLESQTEEQGKVELKSLFVKFFKSVWRIISSVYFACSMCIVTNLTVIILQAVWASKYKRVSACPAVSIILALLVLMISLIQRVKFAKEQLFKNIYTYHLWGVIKYLVVFATFGITVGYVAYMSSGTIKNPLNLSTSAYLDLQLGIVKRVVILVITILALLSDVLLIVFLWELPKKARIQILMALCGFANFLLGVILVKICYTSSDPHHPKNVGAKPAPILYIYSAAFLICGSIMTVSLSFVVNQQNRLDDLVGLIVLMQDCLYFVIALLCLISAGNSLQRIETGDPQLPVSIPSLFFSSFALCCIIVVCTRLFRSRHPPNFGVEELDLATLTDSQKSAYAKLITFNKKSNPGVSGEAVILLMEAYCQTSLNGMNCKVLRVFKKPQEKDESVYEQSSTWDSFDREETVFDEEQTLFELDVIEAPKPLTKNQRKKLAKKAAQKGGDFPLELNTEQDFKERMEFHSKLMATEALVLFTCIEQYDLTETLTGKFGQAIQSWFGKNSRSKLLCVRFALLAFHWPFVRSTFYCSQSKRPVARSAAVMYAISRWNSQQPRSKRCTILLDPTYKNASPEQAIRFGGWYKINLPSSHIINLKPHKGKTLTQYLKSIKYRNQDADYKRAGGETVEVKDFDDESCETVMRLWRKIADGRSEKGNTSTLAKPDAEFVKCIGSVSNTMKNRSILFLKVDGEVIASCVLFRIGDTITSDLQGLDHEKSRPMKAYFVMMQEVIAIALKEGKSFVDFGPTTEAPKVKVGCKSVPLTGALRTTSPILSVIVSVAAGNVNV